MVTKEEIDIAAKVENLVKIIEEKPSAVMLMLTTLITDHENRIKALEQKLQK